ncbi:MAG: hypothetical protein R3B45_01170 [Bdellovibrionota bacterium]
MSQFFTEIKCMDNDGNVLDFECPCGADQDGNPIEKKEIENEDGEKELSCPALEEGQSPPVALVQVSQEGTFDTLKVSLLNSTDVKGCVGNYIRQDGWGTSDASKYTDDVAFENYCTKKSFTMETALAGTATESSEFLSTADDAQWTTSRLSLNPDHGDSFNMEFPIKME